MGRFLCGVETVKGFVNEHSHCIVSIPKVKRISNVFVFICGLLIECHENTTRPREYHKMPRNRMPRNPQNAKIHKMPMPRNPQNAKKHKMPRNPQNATKSNATTREYHKMPRNRMPREYHKNGWSIVRPVTRLEH